MSSAECRRRLYAQIPKDTDVVVTHGPPYRILDASAESGEHSGCRELFDAVMRVQPRLHVFGHVHGGYGIFQAEHTTFVNAALLGMHGDLNKAPVALKMSQE
jgi:Icc-related predicted phosphoesterase